VAARVAAGVSLVPGLLLLLLLVLVVVFSVAITAGACEDGLSAFGWTAAWSSIRASQQAGSKLYGQQISGQASWIQQSQHALYGRRRSAA
jgi:K+-transporting ATPase c subunit